MNLGKLTSCIHFLPLSAKHADNLKVLCACIDQCMPPLHRASDRCHLDYMVNTGPGDITVFSSEMLKFEEEQRILEEAANAALEEAAKALERPHTPPSRRGSGNMEQLSSPRGKATACQ